MEAGTTVEDVLLAVVYMTDLPKNAVNQAFEEFLDNPPTRNLVEVSDIGEGTIVEIAPPLWRTNDEYSAIQAKPSMKHMLL